MAKKRNRIEDLNIGQLKWETTSPARGVLERL
jgi:hypothetical protein